ncbi:MAG TPA: hypothetical protein VM537_20685 [Anaerolineae bacterium]|nr:hypothetical protein [Anaerolineae bacterium]
MTPSTVKVTVPEGCVEPTTVGVMEALTGSVLPSAGEVVDGVSTRVVGVLATVMLMLAVVPLTTEPLPTLAPSRVKVTVPVGMVVRVVVPVLTVAVTSMVLPPRGEVEDGVTARVVNPLVTLMATTEELAAL